MRVNWKNLKNRIPHQVKLGKTLFEVMWVDEFKNQSTMGETRFSPPQIVIKNQQSDKESVKTYIHEILHGISDEGKIGLTENQVIALEKSLPYLLKPDNIFIDKRKRNAKTKQRKSRKRIRRTR